MMAPTDSNSSTESSSDGCNVRNETAQTDRPSTKPPITVGSITYSTNHDLQIERSKFFVLFGFAVTSIVFSSAIYYFLQREELKLFYSEYDSFTSEIIEVSQVLALDMSKAIEGLAFSISAYVVDIGINNKNDATTRTSWPYVTFPNLDVLTRYTLPDSVFATIVPFVSPDQREEWDDYVERNSQWIESDRRTASIQAIPFRDTLNFMNETYMIYQQHESETPSSSSIQEPVNEISYAPIWQTSPTFQDVSFVSFNLFQHPIIREMLDIIRNTKDAVRTFVEPFDTVDDHFHEIRSTTWQYHNPSSLLTDDDLSLTELTNTTLGMMFNTKAFPQTMVLQPLFSDISMFGREKTERANSGESSVVGALMTVFPWDIFFTNILSEGADGLVVVANDSCSGHVFTFEIQGPEPVFIGNGDLHDPYYNDLVREIEFDGLVSSPYSIFESNRDKVSSNLNIPACHYKFHIYGSDDFARRYLSMQPISYALSVGLLCWLLSAVFVIYDSLVQRRHRIVLGTLNESIPITSATFPSEANVYDEVLAEAPCDVEERSHSAMTVTKDSQGTSCTSTSSRQVDPETEQSCINTDCTIMVANVHGFNGWCASREPSAALTLVESIYCEMDRLVHDNNDINKVETFGGGYVAVAGLHCTTDKNHAVIMAQFASHVLQHMEKILPKLTESASPRSNQDEVDLKVRVGLHSGPVAARLSSSEKSCFQLFGDTMNLALRMETTGAPNHIHISEESAKLLKVSGKEEWLEPRVNAIEVGERPGLVLHTFWLDMNGRQRLLPLPVTKQEKSDAPRTTPLPLDNQPGKHNAPAEAADVAFKASEQSAEQQTKSQDSLLQWNTHLLLTLLKQVIAARINKSNLGATTIFGQAKLLHQASGDDVIDQVVEVMPLQTMGSTSNESKTKEIENSVQLDERIVKQVGDLVASIASMYNDNPFHNFEHATHVTKSVMFLLSRMSAADAKQMPERQDDPEEAPISSELSFTRCMSDPLTRFAIAFATIAHDVDHPGVPNAQLVKEDNELAILYKNRSVAEQNSVELTWDLFMEDRYRDFRNLLTSTSDEFIRFRQIFINCMIATDLMDQNQLAVRNSRWNKAFDEQVESKEDGNKGEDSASVEIVHRQATTLIEHLVQASDIAHTMQHWQVYRRWNENLFLENYHAYKAGRAENDPAIHWYEDELAFFDNCVIPLASKLSWCGAFGDSSEKCWKYAMKNREEWEANGKDVVAEMVAKQCHNN